MTDRPGPYDDIDRSALTDDEYYTQISQRFNERLAAQLAEHGPVDPSTLSRAKMRDVMGDAWARGLTEADIARNTEEAARAKAAREARRTQSTEKTDQAQTQTTEETER
jgi:hypothetical protein